MMEAPGWRPQFYPQPRADIPHYMESGFWPFGDFSSVLSGALNHLAAKSSSLCS